jgi:phosphoglycerate dehydrogenase-like enzyme
MDVKMVMLPPQSDVTRRWAEQLTNDVQGLSVVVCESDDEAATEIGDADAAFGTLPPQLLANATRLRWLQAPAAAPPAGYYSPELVAHPLVVTNFRGVYNDHLGTHAMALTLALARNLQRYLPKQHLGKWDPNKDPSSVIHLPEATALIIGVGGVGTALVGYCKAFGMRVIGVDLVSKDVPDAEMHTVQELDRLLPEADVVILTVPHTPDTEGLMDARRFALMKSSAVLVNIGRGMTVRLDDLQQALINDEIAGAGLDVYEIEPLPPEHPLWTTPNVLLTPHTAMTGPHTPERRYEVFVENARRFVAGEQFINVSNKELGF